ncbi:MAG: hypothetical protein R2784_11195 [Saprospiraceae bacterium]
MNLMDLNTPHIRTLPFGIAQKPSIMRVKTMIAAAILCCSFAFPSGLLAQPGCDNVTNGGSITGDETGCPNLYLTIIDFSVTLPSGGTGTIEYVDVHDR